MNGEITGYNPQGLSYAQVAASSSKNTMPRPQNFESINKFVLPNLPPPLIVPSAMPVHGKKGLKYEDLQRVNQELLKKVTSLTQELQVFKELSQKQEKQLQSYTGVQNLSPVCSFADNFKTEASVLSKKIKESIVSAETTLKTTESGIQEAGGLIRNSYEDYKEEVKQLSNGYLNHKETIQNEVKKGSKLISDSNGIELIQLEITYNIDWLKDISDLPLAVKEFGQKVSDFKKRLDDLNSKQPKELKEEDYIALDKEFGIIKAEKEFFETQRSILQVLKNFSAIAETTPDINTDANLKQLHLFNDNDEISKENAQTLKQILQNRQQQYLLLRNETSKNWKHILDQISEIENSGLTTLGSKIYLTTPLSNLLEKISGFRKRVETDASKIAAENKPYIKSLLENITHDYISCLLMRDNMLSYCEENLKIALTTPEERLDATRDRYATIEKKLSTLISYVEDSKNLQRELNSYFSSNEAEKLSCESNLNRIYKDVVLPDLSRIKRQMSIDWNKIVKEFGLACDNIKSIQYKYNNMDLTWTEYVGVATPHEDRETNNHDYKKWLISVSHIPENLKEKIEKELENKSEK